MARIPASRLDVTATWLRAVLGSGRAPRGESLRVTRIGEGYGLASEVLRCAWESGSVVVKLWSIGGATGMREVMFFRAFGDRVGVRTAACLHAEADAASTRAVLVLEDLGDVAQGDCLAPVGRARAEALARMLATLHATWWADPSLAGHAWLPSIARLDRQAAWIEPRRVRFLERFGDRIDAQVHALMPHAESMSRMADDVLGRSAETLVHGDLHLDNVVFERPGDDPVILDWARVARGPAASDLSDLIAEVTRPEHRDAVFAAYAEVLIGRGVMRDHAALEEVLGAALLRRFVRATCGVANWEPASPREETMIERGISRAMDSLEWLHERSPRWSPRV